MAVDGSWGRYHGPHCEALSRRLSELHGVRHVHLCGSGTAAVELALRGLKIGPGDEVVLAAYDFKANFVNVLTVGATPVLVDVGIDWQLDVQQVAAGLSPRTKAVIATHLHGEQVDMPLLRHLADQHGFAIIEDACQAHGAHVAGKPAGAWGDVGVTSFGGSKLVTAGRGGAVLTDRDDVAQRIRLYTQRGNDAYPLSEMQAAVLLPQYDRLVERNARRWKNASQLITWLGRAGGPSAFQSADEHSFNVYYKLALWYDPAAFDGLPRDRFAEALRAEGVALDRGYRPVHLIHGRQRFRAVNDLPVATMLDERGLVLHHPVLLGDEGDLRQIVAAVDKIRRHARMLREVSGQSSVARATVLLSRMAAAKAVVPAQRTTDNGQLTSPMLNYSAAFAAGLPYADFLKRYATAEQLHRWNDFHGSVQLNPPQVALLQSFTREMPVLVLAGAWCGDCINQCPIFHHFETAQPLIRVRYCDRDETPDLAAELHTCGAARVPAVAFLSEDGHLCGRYGDRTLSKYRSLIANLGGASCPTGLATDRSLTKQVVQDWLDEFERIQWLLRTSGRLRQLHGD
jgi:dTDP-4-amino-4,6-dideoxygalactose transaminase/thiol-disulfide isomerase/thioredoxin